MDAGWSPHGRGPPTRIGLRGRRAGRRFPGQYGVMLAFAPPDIQFVPLAEAINRIRTVPRTTCSYRSPARSAFAWGGKYQ